MLAIKLIVGLLLIFFVITFAAKNQQPVDISYYLGYDYNVKLWIAILVSFGLGIVLSGIGWSISFVREKSKNWGLSRKIKKLEEEINELRQKPLPDETHVYPSKHAEHKPAELPASLKETKALAASSSASS